MVYNAPEIVIVVAHPSEEEAVRMAMDLAGCRCGVLVTGVGGAAMSWSLQRRITAAVPSLVIGAGIAGSYSDNYPPGSVVTVGSECFADMGLDDNGKFISLFDAGLAGADTPPFSDGRIICSGRYLDLALTVAPRVRGATVNMTSGSAQVIDRIRRAWDPEIETMEGAWLAYVCAMAGIPWISLRAVSNMVEPRNRELWDTPLALRNLREKLFQFLELIKES